MAQVKGPLHSDKVTGTIGHTMTFGTTAAGQQFARPYRYTKQRMPLVLNIRQILHLMMKLWNYLTEEERETWRAYARHFPHLPPRVPGSDDAGFQIFLWVNIARMLTGLPPLLRAPGH